MAVSARLRRDLDARLARFCGTRGISKTQAIERGLELLLEQDQGQRTSPTGISGSCPSGRARPGDRPIRCAPRSVRSILVDTGAVIGLLSPTDRHHAPGEEDDRDERQGQRERELERPVRLPLFPELQAAAGSSGYPHGRSLALLGGGGRNRTGVHGLQTAGY